MTEEEFTSFLDVYDDLAVEIVDDVRKNTDAALDFSNQELAENICQTMEWEDFDLLSYFGFEDIHRSSDARIVLAHAFISFLRWRLFSEASRRGIGDVEFNQRAEAYSEYWYIALVHRWNALSNGAKMRPWLN